MALKGGVGTGNLGGQSSFFFAKRYGFWDKFSIGGQWALSQHRCSPWLSPLGTDAMGNLEFGMIPYSPLSLLFAEQSPITSQIPWICLGYPCWQRCSFFSYSSRHRQSARTFLALHGTI